MMRRIRRVREIAGAEEGTLLVIFGVSLTVLLGIVALSFDMGRIDATQSELQSFADSVALAAAGELDRQPTSISRATAAAANLIADTQTYGNGGATLDSGDFTLTFYETLPGADTSALTSSTTNPEKAAYVHVQVSTHTVQLTFAAAFNALRPGGGAPDNTVSAQAVAGFTQYACDISPLMFCLPNAAGFNATSATGTMINLRSARQNAAWGPGDFGFLDPSSALVDDEGPCGGESGGNLRRCLMAAEGSITQCYPLNGVDVEPGQAIGSTDAAFNVRFDIYASTMNGKRNDADYQPAPNVVKGIVPQGGGSCIGNNEDPSPDTIALPRDTCLGAGTCGTGARYGDGTFSWTSYLNTNHGGADPSSAYPMAGDLAGTRWEMYNAEISASGGGDILSGLAETGRPECSSNMSGDPYRRVVIAAGIDCTANPINGAATGVPVQEFYKIFLTEPVGNDGNTPPTFDIWGEVIGSAGGAAGGGGGAIIHDVVQLYR